MSNEGNSMRFRSVKKFSIKKNKIFGSILLILPIIASIQVINGHLLSGGQISQVPISGSIVNTYSTGSGKGITHDDQYLYATCMETNNIHVYNVSTDTLVRTLTTSHLFPSYDTMGIAYYKGNLYVAEGGSGTIHMLDPETGGEQASYSTPYSDISGLTWINDDLWFAIYSGQQVIKYDLASETAITGFGVDLGNTWGVATDGYHLLVLGGANGSTSGVPTVQVFESDKLQQVSEFTISGLGWWQGMTFWNDSLYLNAGYEPYDTYEIELKFSSTVEHQLMAPTVTLLNSGEAISGTYTIQWTPATDSWGHIVFYSLYYSSNDRESWTLLTSNLITTKYDWDTKTVPDGSNYWIKVVASCQEGLIMEDVSDREFSVNNAPTANSGPPSIEYLPAILGTLVMGVIFCGAGMFGFQFYTYLRSVPEAVASWRWPSVNGTIDNSSMSQRYDHEGDMVYQATIVYSYQVGNTEYQSSRIKMWRTLGGSHFDATKGFAKKQVAKYPVEKEVSVYYNPDKPENAVLERGSFLSPFSGEFWIFFGGGLFTLMGLGMIQLGILQILAFPDLTILAIIALTVISAVGYRTWRSRQTKKAPEMSYSPEVPSRMEEPVIQQIPPKTSERTKKYFIESTMSTYSASFVINDENNNVVLQGGSLISERAIRLGTIVFIGAVFIPPIIFLIFLLILIPILPIFIFDLGLFPLILVIIFIGWPIGFTLFINRFSNRFRFTYRFQDEDGNPFGELRANWRMSSWKIVDPRGAVMATLRFSGLSKKELFRIDTPHGLYTAFYKHGNIEVLDSYGVLACTLLNYGQMIQSEGVLSSFITILTGTCVIVRGFQQRLQRQV
jgi:hypothetical protein